ncbi:non-hydrolyzing UDP-N-acetylglucosamine 2-epimerase [Agrococcus sp. SGAir0287]|uniref:non-hydrolyzing UDP-N-acetylglucosamine 2-epimerase n=1 Tax=Agrococcus sp. SGAir0287 TaxID=2070347 RepID=UPI0010CD37E3|nr:UDP-N-acetylglucosamine 2-epimerase (non-hydrolyzing) [Agrococcus sp. SGAir0287]QCR19867.1 UDP-N-acetylglucosamine 2-epimerase (non-hydrolyzing) [Agrococcus sp. SGAir0287]
MSARLKVMTVVGTRPEIIRLAATMRLLDRLVDHVVVHTGQNYDYELNELLFEDLELRRPDRFLAADTSSLGAALGTILARVETAIAEERPDAMLVLGDTNSCIAAVMGRRMRVPVFHMEAGNRAFDENVPEETNRRLVDHVADYNLAYTEHARRNLLAEGLHPSRVVVTGSPMREVLAQSRERIEASDVLERQGLARHGYLLVSLHREETVDDPVRLERALRALDALGAEHDAPVLVSTHPRTRRRLAEQAPELLRRLTLHAPFGFHDYVALQRSALVVLSDSGTIAEESSILGFPAVTLRDAIERPEALDVGAIVTSGVDPEGVVEAVRATLALHAAMGPPTAPVDYAPDDVSRRVASFILSSTRSHRERAGLRR